MQHAAITLDTDYATPLPIEAVLDGHTYWQATTKLFDLPLISGTREEVARHLVSAAVNGQYIVANFVNAHCINTLKRDRDYGAAVRSSDMILPDGSGLRIASQMMAAHFEDNLNGTDLFPEICREAAGQGQPIFLLGGAPDVAARASRTMMEKITGLTMAGSADGYFSSDKEDALIARINASGARILMVGFGVPLQEKWIARNRHRLRVPVIMGVGGLFDYYAGNVPRAPKAVRAVGCEWIWRLAIEPRRLAGRYIVGNAIFLGHVWRERQSTRRPTNTASKTAKRWLDILVAALAITILFPVILAVILAIKLEDGGPVLFRQLRIGENGRSFPMYKFRSMYTDAEERRAALLGDSEREGICFKMREDPRITKTGKFIRRFSIDELPQLFNVLLGHMSLVGPRPALGCEVSSYSQPAYRRLQGKPGITCIWQVSGRAEIPFERQLAMDVAYLRQKGFITDLWLLIRTVPAVLTGRGAY